MTNEQKLREFATKQFPLSKELKKEALYNLIQQAKQDECFSDLTALISEGYVSKEKAGYPLEFIEWLIKDQEIFFGELNEEYILNDNIHVDGRKLQTIDELFNYWKENEQ